MLEKADALMRQSDQYSQWQKISQKSDSEVRRVAQLLLQRQEMVQKFTRKENVNHQLFDSLTTKLAQAGLSLPSSEYFTNPRPSSPLPSAQTPAVVNNSNSLIQEENLLILDIISPALRINETLFSYGDGQTNQLPLQSISDLFDFSIQVDPENGKATGWFVNENRTLRIDATSQTIEADGTVFPWNAKLISVGEDDIYIDSSLMSKIFPIDFEVSTNEMTIQIEPREKLPIELLLEREERRLKLLNKTDNSLKYEAQDIPYTAYSFPVLDVSLGSKIGNPAGETDLLGNYSILAEGDLAYMGAELFLSGSDNDPLNTARFALNRKDLDKELLGPMKASEIYIGDISPVNFSVLDRPANERGVAISNSDLLHSYDFDTTHFQGNVQPGWDVELHRNGRLINSMRILADGEYRFENVDVFFGKNDFKIIAFGPQGQEKIVDQEVITVGGGMQSQGELNYKLSTTQRKKTLTGINEKSREDTSDGTGRFNTNITYGLTDSISLAGGVSSVEFDSTRHNYLMTGLRGSFSGFYGEADYIFDTESGSGLALQGQTGLGPLNIKAKYEKYDNFIEEKTPDRALESKAYLGINGSTPAFKYFPSFSYLLSTENTFYNKYDTGLAKWNLSTNINRLNLANDLTWSYLESSGDSAKNIIGNFRASGPIGGTRLMGELNYSAGDENSVNRYILSASRNLGDKLFGSTALTYIPGDNEQFSANVGLSWDAGNFYLSPTASIDSDGTYSAFLRLSFSLGQDPVTKDIKMESKPRSNSGSVTAFVYHDANNNQVFDEDDTPLPDVMVKAHQVTVSGDTNEKGVAGLNRMQAFKSTDVEIDVDTLEDPFWQPSTPGTAVTPRSGVVGRLNFPVVTTGEIDGTIYALKPDGSQEGLQGVTIEMINEDEEVVQSVTSEYDGFYLFEKVFPGTYTLRLKPVDDFNTENPAGLLQKIVIGNDGTVDSGNDVILKMDAPPQQRSMQQPAPTLLKEDTEVVRQVGEAEEKVQATAIESVTDSEQNESTHRMMVNGDNTTFVADSEEFHSSIRIAPLNIQPGIQQVSQPSVPVSPKAQQIVTAVKDPAAPVASSSPAQKNVPETIITTQPMRLADQSFSSFTGKHAPVVSNPIERSEPKTIDSQQTNSPVHGGHWVFEPIGRIIHSSPQQAVASNQTRLRPTAQQPAVETAPVVLERHNGVDSISPAGNTGNNLSQNQDNVEQVYGVHLASYKSVKDAQRGIQVLKKQLNGAAEEGNLRIVEVDLGPEKGIWFRVVYGEFADQHDTDRIAESFLEKIEYAKSIAVNREPARENSREVVKPKTENSLQTSNPVNDGHWLFDPIGRIIHSSPQAVASNQARLRQATQQPAVETSPVAHRTNSGIDSISSASNTSDNSLQNQDSVEQAYGVHLASYKSVEDAQRGIQVLKKQLNGAAAEGILRIVEVDLGPEKGIWFRVVYGEFADKHDTDRIAESFLKKTKFAKSVTVNREQIRGQSREPVEQIADNLNIQKRSIPQQQYHFIAATYAAIQQMDNRKR
ncbi:SdrD B-like domain-containing protein [Desulfogranum japonicum]|uniref:SdrD B-like domain-containing protein n=1 Tax=Desulfogranum japonicum TaxID=231447 RepID=UPI0003FBE471|nr:SdrD B-like domain-containing protein [Desulfogranum japonicum]